MAHASRAFLSLLVLTTAVFSAACYSPNIKNGGFTCTVGDPAGCPDGYSCLAGVCQNGPAAVTAGSGDGAIAPSLVDASASSNDSGAQNDSHDLRSVESHDLRDPADLRESTDLRVEKTDMREAGDLATCSLEPNGGACKHDNQCCSNWCDYGTYKCITKP